MPINDNLEAMAKQLYDYWFVQFDFPNEEGKPYKSSGGTMVWNEKLKREIPQGWSVKNLGQIATSYQQGLIRSNNQLSTDSKYGYLKMGDLDGKGQYTLQGLIRTNATNEEVDLYSLHKGDFLINVRNSKEIVGKTCLIDYVERNTLYNHMLVRLNFKDVSTFYMNLLFNSEFMYKALDGLKQGTTTVIALYQNDLYRLPILIPAPCVMEHFSKITDSILDQKEIISHEIEELTKQRDELIPLLMNGQATVNYHLSASTCISFDISVLFLNFTNGNSLYETISLDYQSFALPLHSKENTHGNIQDDKRHIQQRQRQGDKHARERFLAFFYKCTSTVHQAAFGNAWCYRGYKGKVISESK